MSENPFTAGFFHALHRLDSDSVRAFLERDRSLANTPMKEGRRSVRTPLQFATDADNIELVALLLHYKADVNYNPRQRRKSPIQYAQSREVAQLLVDHVPDVNMLCNGRYGFRHHDVPLLFTLIRPNRLEAARVLIERGADINAMANASKDEYVIACIHEAARYNRPEMIDRFLDSGVGVNAKTKAGRTPLYYALFTGLGPRVLESARQLIRRGADVNAKETDGHSLFLSACEAAQLDAMQLLIDHGADPKLDGDIALLRAVGQNKVEVIKFLLNLGIDPNCLILSDRILPVRANATPQRGNMGRARRSYEMFCMAQVELDARKKYGHVTPLLLACHNKNTLAVQMLLEMGADANVADRNGCTPVVWASAMGHWEIVKILVSHGANVNIVMHDDGYTPLSMACMNNEAVVAGLLLESGARVDSKSKPLLCAAERGHVECATLLLKRGANMHAANHRGDTPFLLACQFGVRQEFDARTGVNAVSKRARLETVEARQQEARTFCTHATPNDCTRAIVGVLDMIYFMLRFSMHHRRPEPRN